MITALVANDTGTRAWAEDSAARLGMANWTMGQRLDAVASRAGALETTLENMTAVAGDPLAEAERLREGISAMNLTLLSSIATIGTMARRTEARVSRIRVTQDPFPFMPMVRPMIVTHSPTVSAGSLILPQDQPALQGHVAFARVPMCCADVMIPFSLISLRAHLVRV